METKKIYCFDFDGTLTTKDTLIEFICYAKGSARLMLAFLLYSPLLVLMKLRLYPNYKAKQKIFAHLFGGMAMADFDQLCRDFAADNPRLMRPAAIDLLFRCREQGERVLVVSASVDNWVRPFMDQLQLTNVKVLGTQVEEADGYLTGRFKTKNCYGLEKVVRISEEILRGERGEEKVERKEEKDMSFSLLPSDSNRPSRSLSSLLSPLSTNKYYIVAYGDSRGDKEMLAFADEAHYKPFREKGKGKIEKEKEDRNMSLIPLSSDSNRPSRSLSSLLSPRSTNKYAEIVRFGVVGAAATLLQYGIYLALMPLLACVDPTIDDHAMATTANTVAYIVSFAFNFVASTHFTFRVKANARRGMGFTLSHIINYTLQTLFLNVFVGMGLAKQLAMIPTLCICIPINFLLVRYFLKR